MKRINGSESRGGFTLIEVMIALAVVGGLLVTLLYTLNYHLGVAERHEAETIAMLLADEKLQDVRRTPEESEGKFPEPYSDYEYKVTLRGTPYPGVSEVSVSVSRGGARAVIKELLRGGLK